MINFTVLDIVLVSILVWALAILWNNIMWDSTKEALKEAKNITSIEELRKDKYDEITNTLKKQ